MERKGTHLWNKLMNPHHAVPLGKDAHKTSIIHCINSGWKLPSITSLLISVSLHMCHTDLTCFDEVYFTILSFQSQVHFGYITLNFDVLKWLSNIYVYSMTSDYSITLPCKPQTCIQEFFWLAYSMCKSHTL